MKLSIVKPIAAKWMIDLHNDLVVNPQIIKKSLNMKVYDSYNRIFYTCKSLMYGTPHKKLTFRSYSVVSLFNYVHARYAVQLTYLWFDT